MMDEPPEQQEAIWQRLRTVEPASGSKQRVYRAVEARIARRTTFRWLIAPIMVAAAAALIFVSLRPGAETGRPRVVSASNVRQGERLVEPGERLGDQAVRVTERMSVAFDG